MSKITLRFVSLCGALALLLLCACGGAADYALEAPPAPQRASHGGYALADDAGDTMEMEAMEPDAEAADMRFANRGEPGDAGMAGQPAQPTPGPTPPTPPVVDASAPPDTKQPYQKAKPLLIYTANYHLAVFEATASIDTVQKMASELGGYLVRRDDRAITIRVPSETFRAALGRIGKLGDVLHREETVQDVTDQFMDMQTRLKNARAMRDRLEQLLSAAKDVKDALAVEKELGRVTGDIERMEGKLKRLRELIAFSTITIQFQARPTDKVNSKVRLPFDWLNSLGLTRLLNL